MNGLITNLMDLLKEAIRDRHARMETLPFVIALTGGDLPMVSYVSQLRALAVIHGVLDHELHLSNLEGMKALYRTRPLRLAHLRSDLGALDQLFVPDCLETLEHARSISEQIRRYREKEPMGLLGMLYVLEGTTLGNAVHLPDVVRTFGDRVAGATHYYTGYGDKTDLLWQEFRCVMNAITPDRTGYESLLTAVHRFFDQLEALYRTLYPYQETGWNFSVDALNPEAGQHAVPDDPYELQAVESAARRCREEFPYFDERYQERGQRFAKSDAGWLVTIATLPLVPRMSQIEWLGRVLGNRGMPRITIERQLELLYEELVLAVPAEREKYAGLLEAAAYLKAERGRVIPEVSWNRVARQFHFATDGESRGRFRNTGTLLVAAVCDEASGITEAVGSLLSWLMDPERFSEQWRAAVTAAIEAARNEVITHRGAL